MLLVQKVIGYLLLLVKCYVLLLQLL